MPGASELNLFQWDAGDKGGVSSRDLSDALSRGENGTIIGKMLESGRIVIHDDASSLPVEERPAGVIQGATMPDGTVHLVAGNLSPETARGVLLHEVFHAGAQKLVGSRAWNALMERVQRATNAAMERAVTGQSHPSDDFWSAALARGQAVEVPTEHLAEEVAAYGDDGREVQMRVLASRHDRRSRQQESRTQATRNREPISYRHTRTHVRSCR